MKRLLLLLLSSLSFFTVSHAQIYYLDYFLDGDKITTCKGMFTSSGYIDGPSNSYQGSDDYTVTFCSGGGPLRINFNYANFYPGDYLEIFDGASTGSVKVKTLSGTSNDHVYVTSSGTCLTFRFRAFGTGTAPSPYNGWQAFLGCTPAGCDGNLPASDVCGSAPVICNLDGYCGSTSGWYTADNVSTLESMTSMYCSSSWTIQNNSWLAFIANSATATFTIKSSNCSDGTHGMQAVVLETSNCTSFNVKSSCVYDGQGTFSVTANSLTVGKKYYIMIDGGYGNDCDYTVSASSGVTVITLSATSSTICQGQSTTLSVNSGGTATAYKWLPGGQTTSSITVSPTSTTTYTCEVTGSCDQVQKPTVKITVKPSPVATATPASQSFCSGGTTSISLSSSMASTTYSWGVTKTGGTTTGSASGTGSSISQTLNATGTTAGIVTYNVTPTSGGCAGNVLDVPVTVNPVPTLTATPSSQTFCSGGTTSIALTSNIAGTTFSWTVLSSTGVSGASAGSGTSIAQKLTATGTVAGSVTYEITPTTAAPASCPGSKKTVTVTVNPRPTITPTANAQTICSGSSTSIGLQSDISGTTYSWTVVVTGGVTGASNGSGSNIVQTLYTSGTTVGTVEYTITATTPAPASCTNSSVTKVLVTVNPIPTISINTPAAICDGQSVNLTATVAPAGGTFLWTPGNLTTNPITVSPNTTTNYSVQYTVNNCSNSTSRNVTVNPKPSVSINTSSSSICAGKTTTLTASSPDAGGTYSWAPGGATTNAITVSPAGNTTYTVTYTIGATTCSQTATSAITVLSVPTVTVTPTSANICSGASTTLNTNASPAGGTYAWSPGGASTSAITVSPTTSTTYTLTYTAGNGCSVSNSSAAINVTPLDDASFSYPSPTYCTIGGTNPTPTVTGLGGGTFTATPAGLSINATTGVINLGASSVNTYAVKYTTNGACPNSKTVNLTIVGSADATFSYAGTPYCQYAPNAFPIFNPGSSAGVFSAVPAGLVFVNTSTGEVDLNASTPGTYTVTNTIPAGNGCLATFKTSSITITTAPVLVASSKNDTICTGNPTTVTLSGGNSYDWTVVSPASITGASNVTGNTTGIIGQTLVTSAVVPGTVHYIITPKNTVTTCVGKSDSVHVTVHPVPTVSATPTTPSVCSGLVTDIKLTSNIPTATFKWTVLSSTGASGANSGTGAVINDVLTATGTTPGSVVYHITPSAFANCDGTPIDVTVTVNPNPTTVVSIPSGDDTICSGEKTSIHLSSSTGGTVFTWTVNQSGVSGGSSSSGTDIMDSLVALGTVPGKAVYNITGTANGCSGATAIDSIIVNPIPTLVVTPLKQEICSGAQTNIALVSNITPTTFVWTVTPNTITGASNGSTAIGNIVQTLVNPGSVVDTATYHIVASAGGCLSSMNPLVDSVVAKIAVNPKPVISAATPLSICSGDTVKIPLSTNVAGSIFAYKATTASVIGAGDGSGTLIEQGLSVNVVSDSVIYTITATSEQGCISTPFKSIVYVNPRPVISFILSPGSTICSGTAVSAFLTTNVPGSVFTWTPRPSIVIGPKSGSGPNPSSFNDVLSVTSDTAATVIYDVTASKGGCMNAAMSSLVQFTVNPLPKIIPSMSSATICDGDSIDIALTSNVPGTDFTWTVAQIDVTGAVADSGQTHIKQALKLTGNGVGTATYAITSYSPAGCHNSSVFSLPVKVNPLENAAFHYSSIKYCQNELNPSAIITGGATGTFSSLPLGLNITDINSGKVDLKGSTPGNYIVAFKTSGKCSQTGYQNIIINAQPKADTSSVVIGASNCGSSTGTITGITTASGTAPFKYEWKNSSGVIVDTTLVLDSVPPGFYTLKITDANGCSVTVGSGNSMGINYLKTVTAAFTSDVTSGEIPLNVQFTNQSTSTGVINYNWVFDNGATSTLKDPATTFNEIKTYKVCLYVDDGGKGCKDTACAPIEVFTNSDITIVPNVFTPNGDGINDVLMITAKGLGSVNAQIFNRWGQKEYEWNTLNGGWDGYSASGIPAVEGTYYIILYATGADKNKTVFPPIKQSFTLLR
jgi:gliding motility-associated-like protein